MTVYLVGAGPGDPGLLTVRGAELLSTADVVVYDRLSVSALLELAPESAERVNVGKYPGHATMPQEAINALLVERGRLGQVVVRLKGGDPFVFARGGEEARALLDAGVAFEVVPGISSAIAVPAYAGIPVTLRHSSELFTVITGHEDPGKGDDLDWEVVARLGGTIVVLMGVGRLPRIVERLLAGGLPAGTPVAAVRWGTRPEQHTVRATLATICDHELASPSVIVIGKVAAEDLSWYESKPLFGKRVVVTRTRAQASMLARLLRAEGAEPIEVPLIEITDAVDGGVSLRNAVAQCRSYDWVVLTSPNGASRFVACLRDARQLGDTQVAVIGPGTADVMRAANIEPDLMPDRFVAEGLVEAFPRPGAGSGRVLLPQAADAREVLALGLRAMGWRVHVVEAYRTSPAVVTPAQREMVASADAIAFMSSSTIDLFVEAFDGDDLMPRVVASIGPITSATARGHGIKVSAEATDHTVAGLVDALVACVAPTPAHGVGGAGTLGG